MKKLDQIIDESENRYQIWVRFIRENSLETIAEIGVYRGEFAEKILTKCNGFVKKYYMIDPWKNLSDWNKPANTNNEEFELFYQETVNRTKFASEKRIILRGKTSDVVHKINENALDFVYIDGDHTLRGITIDLMSIWDKVKSDGFIAGDDFCTNIWQHKKHFEPTFVFPYAVYFAEAMNVKIFALPFNQFLIYKGSKSFEFIDFTNGKYNDTSLLSKIKIETKKPTFISKFLKKFE